MEAEGLKEFFCKGIETIQQNTIDCISDFLDEVHPEEVENKRPTENLWEFNSADIFSETQKQIKDVKYQKLIQKKLSRKKKKNDIGKMIKRLTAEKKITSLGFPEYHPL